MVDPMWLYRLALDEHFLEVPQTAENMYVEDIAIVESAKRYCNGDVLVFSPRSGVDFHIGLRFYFLRLRRCERAAVLAVYNNRVKPTWTLSLRAALKVDARESVSSIHYYQAMSHPFESVDPQLLPKLGRAICEIVTSVGFATAGWLQYAPRHALELAYEQRNNVKLVWSDGSAHGGACPTSTAADASAGSGAS